MAVCSVHSWKGKWQALYEEYRRRGIAESLESYIINTRLSKGLLPYGDIIVGNEPSFGLQRKLGMKITKEIFYWAVVDGSG